MTHMFVSREAFLEPLAVSHSETFFLAWVKLWNTARIMQTTLHTSSELCQSRANLAERAEIFERWRRASIESIDQSDDGWASEFEEYLAAGGQSTSPIDDEVGRCRTVD